MKTVTIRVNPWVGKPAGLLIPKSFNDGNLQCVAINKTNIKSVTEVPCDYANQTAEWLLTADSNQPVTIQYAFKKANSPVHESFFEEQNNRYTTPSDALIHRARTLADQNKSQPDIVAQLMQSAKELFSYGHSEQRFNDGCDAVPAVCGTTKGSCVDINTYLIAAANSLGIKVQYVAGYWFHPERSHTSDMHCWLIFHLEGKLVPWDLAHHLKWGVEHLASGLNPAGGRRVPMSFGRGLNFKSPGGAVHISHFSEPVWVMPDGECHQSEAEISIQD